MNNLLDALLRYATIGKTEEEREFVDLKDVVDIAIINLRVSIEETQAVVNCTQLPIVYSTQSLLVQLFQNLIGNALKYRGDEPPRVHITAETNNTNWVFSVQDNGFGIESQYHDRIFEIFRRLHTQEEFPGTGIGLAVCRRIVQRHRGKIWVESQPEKGSRFCFTIPIDDDPGITR